MNRMAGPVLLLGGHTLGLAVVLQARHQVHLLVQAAAERNVDFLKTPAHAQQWHALLHAGAHQRQRERVAHRIERQIGVAHLLVKVRGVHVGR